MDTKTFDSFRDLVYDKSGINLGDHKQALVSARVGKRMRELGIDDYNDYLKRVVGDNTDEEIVQLLDVISTNVTSFFRENVHFEHIRALFTGWLAQGQRRFRFWSCASSTGEEPYTLAMTLLDAAAGADVDIRILATDISTKVLKKCKEGVYPENKTEGIPPAFVKRFFVKDANSGDPVYRINDTVKSLVSFTRMNLAKPPFLMQGPFDVVFCRNVMIYFDNTVRKGLLNEINRMLKPGGYLYVGHAESLTGLVSGFKSEQASIYCKK